MVPVADAQTLPATDASGPLPHRQWSDDVRLRALQRIARPPPRRPRLLVAIALAVAVALHGVLAIWLSHLSRSHPIEEGDRISVSLIDAPAPEPALPVSLPRPAVDAATVAQNRPAASTPSAPRLIRAPSPSTGSSALPPPSLSAAPRIVLYGTDGSLNVPKDLAAQVDALKQPENFIRRSTATSPLMLPHRPIKMRPNYFARYWAAPPQESLGGEWVRRYLTAEGEFTTPWGSKVNCRVVFLLGGCGFDPPPPVWDPPQTWKPATALDER